MNHFFSENLITSVLSGSSIIDVPSLDPMNIKQAEAFLKNYGYDVQKAEDIEELWGIYRKALSLLNEHILKNDEKIPDHLSDATLLGDISRLVVLAGSAENKEDKYWACCILKVMHAYAHIQNDLFSQFSEQIQDQVLKNFKDHIIEDPALGVRIGKNEKAITLSKFEVKPFKRTSSSVIKLLSKKQVFALSLLDRLGVRFVTKNIYDCFRVIQYLFKENVISLANIMPDQSNNNLYPVNLFFEVIKSDLSDPQEIQKHLVEKLNKEEYRAKYNIKENEFSADEFKFMKFICRQLVEIKIADKNVHFFFPFEVQVIDYDAYVKNLSGPQAHDQYKLRQMQAARLRVLGKK